MAHIERVNILHFDRLGQKFIEWTLNPSTRPNNFDEFKEQLDGIVEMPLPERLKDFRLIDSDLETWNIRLPPKEMVQETLDEVEANPESEFYTLPDFYKRRLVDGEIETNKEFFEFRVGDYLVAHCR